MKISKMTKEWVKEICSWQYEPPYDMYNMSYDLEIEEELLDGSYYGVFDQDILIGFFVLEKRHRYHMNRDIKKDILILDWG